jgi:prepilin-type N-terminal cleavage/methylation domain-containing protein/prepilin-type processing-associated H-X9-DG protein
MRQHVFERNSSQIGTPGRSQRGSSQALRLMVHRSRGGLTLIEVLVALAIIAVLTAITFPAIQHTRETARRLHCLSNLKQIGVAVGNYDSAFTALPTEYYPFRAMLPYLEHSDSSEFTSPPAYVCPADELASRSEGNVSYPLNEGYAYQIHGNNGIRLPPQTDPFFRFAWTRRSDLTDGQAYTAFASERLVVPAFQITTHEESTPRRYLWYIPGSFTSPGQYSSFITACQIQRTTVLPVRFGASPHVSMGIYGYNHCQTPNSVGCYNASTSPLGDPTVPLDFNSAPATSRHSGGVNLLLCDGSARFVADSIDLLAWQSVSTRSGQEVVSAF